MKTMYHVSVKIFEKEKVFFSPKIQKHICGGEDTTIPRICVCPTIKECLSAIPYKDFLVNKCKLINNRLVSILEFNVPDDYVVSNEEVQKYVPDAHLTNEHWIIKPCEANVKIININNIQLSNYFKHAGFQSGYVTDLDYSLFGENKDIEINCTLVSKSALRYAKKLLNKYNIQFNVSEKGYNPFYFYDEGCCCGKTNYSIHWSVLEFTIPKELNCKDLLRFINKQNRIRQRIGGIPFNYDGYEEDENEEYLKELVCINCNKILGDYLTDTKSITLKEDIKYELYSKDLELGKVECTCGTIFALEPTSSELEIDDVYYVEC